MQTGDETSNVRFQMLHYAPPNEKGLMKMAKQAVKQAVRGLGYEIGPYDPRKYERYELADQDNVINGKIVRWKQGNTEVYFFIVDEQDTIQREHNHQRFYEAEELQIIGNSFHGGVFLDVGANVGNHALFAAMFLGASKVISVEPNPVAYRILRVNIGLNGQHDRIVHHAVGLSDAASRASIRLPKHNLGAGQLVLGASSGTIDVLTGDGLLNGSRVDFIKIDTEGMELNVIRGLAQTIARDRPGLFVEVDDKNAAGFFDLMKTINYTIKQHYRRYGEMENYLAVSQ